MTPILLPPTVRGTRAHRDLQIETLHHGDHRSLLHAMPINQAPGQIDAIIVPTARPAAYLDHAITLAMRLDTQLVALCSKGASAARAKERAAAFGFDRLIAVDVVEPPFPRQETTALLASITKVRLLRDTDTSQKRNVGLALMKQMGWNHVVFLDDDITIVDSDQLKAAAGMLSSYGVVGLRNTGFPDNSVVCHAYRAVHGRQTSFIGGGALVVSGRLLESFFPNIYNEDWFFLLDGKWLRNVAMTGEAEQKPFDPFRDPRRARNEEFGDTLAEGVFWLLDEGLSALDADLSFWEKFLPARRGFISAVLHRVYHSSLGDCERNRMIEALRGALGRQEFITPALCVDYLEAWQRDTVAWGKYIRSLPPSGQIGEALHRLGLSQPVS